MRLRKNHPDPEPAVGQVGDVADKLSHVRPIFHDEDERRSAADRSTYHTRCRASTSRCHCPSGSSRASPRSASEPQTGTTAERALLSARTAVGSAPQWCNPPWRSGLSWPRTAPPGNADVWTLA
jgi:hypothetical protein